MYKRKLGSKIYESNTRTFNRDLTLIIVGIAVYQFGTYMMIGQLANYMRSFGMNENTLGTISAIGSLAGMLALVGGVLGKKIGLKWMVILNHCVALPYPLLCAFWPTPAGFTIASIFSRVPYMFNFGIMVYFYTYRCDADKVKAMMTMSAITHITSIFAPTVGGILIEKIGMQCVLVLTALCYVICTALCCFMTREYYVPSSGGREGEKIAVAGRAEECRLGNFVRDKKNLPIFLLMALCACRYICDTSGPMDGVNMITLFYEDAGMNVMQRSYATTFLSLGITVFLLVGSRMTKKRTSWVILLLATLNAVADLSFLTGSTWIITVCAFFRGARSSWGSFAQNAMNRRLPVENQTTLMSFYAAGYNVMQFAATKIGGTLYDVNSFLPFGLEIALSAIWVGLFFLYERKYGQV